MGLSLYIFLNSYLLQVILNLSIINLKKMRMQNMLKQLKAVFTMIVVVMTITATYAQDATIKDEDLRKYAIVMDSIDAMKTTIQKEYNALIQGEELMAGGRRFVEIQSAAGDSVKLNELAVTDEEKMVYNNIQAKYEELTAEFKENYTTLIKDELGGTLYNNITKALRSDEAVKARYEEILAEVKQAAGEAATEADIEG